MSTIEELRTRKSEILALADRRGCRDLRIFGSVIREEDNDDSDIDFLISIDSDRSLVDFVGFKQDLEKLFSRNIDVVTEKSLHWLIRQDVLNEAKPL